MKKKVFSDLEMGQIQTVPVLSWSERALLLAALNSYALLMSKVNGFPFDLVEGLNKKFNWLSGYETNSDSGLSERR